MSNIQKMIVFCCSILFPALDAISQNPNQGKTVAGEYYLTGVMEMASVIRLDPDSTFHFYFSYGAADREGKGKWTIRDSNIILHSKPRPEKDFRLLQSSHTSSDQITITITHPNPVFFSFLNCYLQTADQQYMYKPKQDGIVIVPSMPFQSIGLVFDICGDRISWFTNFPEGHNNFSFTPEEWICDIFCSNLQLKIKELELIGEHPLLKGKQFRYQKK